MALSFFLNLWTNAADDRLLEEWLNAELLPALHRSEVLAIDAYTPETARDRYVAPELAPVLMIELGFAEVAALERCMASGPIQQAMDSLRRCEAPDLAPTCETFRTIAYPVAGRAAPEPRTADFSYVVRYYRPAADEAAFVDFYLSHHPQILGELPGIRNVFCYVPVDWRNPLGIADSDCMLGNEVVFDSVDDLNMALASDVRHRLREDFKRFPPFSGPNTHYGMTRRRISP